MVFGWTMVALTIALTTVGQLVVKWQVNLAPRPAGTVTDYALWCLKLALNPWIIMVFVMAACAAFAWFLAMTRLPLSLAYPFIGLTFPAVAVSAALIFGETLGLWHIVGIALITVGLGLVATGAA